MIDLLTFSIQTETPAEWLKYLGKTNGADITGV